MELKFKAFLSLVLRSSFLGLFILVLDQTTKLLAVQGKIGNLLMNKGIIYGIGFIQQPATQIMFIANIGLILSLIYLYLIFFVLQHGSEIRIALSVLYISILSNLVDRIRFGAVVDFIPLKVGEFYIYLNLADIAQQISLLVVLFIIIKKGVKNKSEHRELVLLDPDVQIKGAFFYGALSFLLCVGVSSTVYGYFRLLNDNFEIDTKQFYNFYSSYIVFCWIVGVYLYNFLYF